MHFKTTLRLFCITAVLLFTAVACNHYISTYDQFAYAQTTSLKIDVLNLIDKSTEAYTTNQTDVDKVRSDMMKAIEYEKHRTNNGITVRMWNKLLDSTGQNGIVGRYLASWKSSGTKNETIINEVKPQVSEGFDLIADLESQKLKSSSATVLNFLNK